MARRTKTVHIAEVVRHGERLIVPETMSYGDAIDMIERQLVAEEEERDTYETIPVSPYDGALALRKAIEQKFGYAENGKQTMGLFGPSGGVRMLSVDSGVNEKVDVPWGIFHIPVLENAHVCTGNDMAPADGHAVFRVHINAKGKFDRQIKEMLSLVRRLAVSESIYRGKAFELRFSDADGDALPTPAIKFLEFPEMKVIFRRSLEDEIADNIFTPILYPGAVKQDGGSLKQGILLAGRYGTGKTLLASSIARASAEGGWTFIYVPKPEELADALRFAAAYQPAVVFCEDVERVAGSERTDEVNELLNTLDGVDNKGAEIITVLTTNHHERINAAMLRPGRIDTLIFVEPADAEAAERLVRLYAAERLEDNADLTAVGTTLDGEIPAVIEEVVSRARRRAIRRSGGNAGVAITAADLKAVAEFYIKNRALFAPVTEKKNSSLEELGRGIGRELTAGVLQAAKHGGNGVLKPAEAGT
ncbi:MAG TPA: ATP-binding protein [Candidatus Paceibacterota bacterium]|nr:ATP-binding protein [Candidatus Paceibacterota bacterium]